MGWFKKDKKGNNNPILQAESQDPNLIKYKETAEDKAKGPNTVKAENLGFFPAIGRSLDTIGYEFARHPWWGWKDREYDEYGNELNPLMNTWEYNKSQPSGIDSNDLYNVDGSLRDGVRDPRTNLTITGSDGETIVVPNLGEGMIKGSEDHNNAIGDLIQYDRNMVLKDEGRKNRAHAAKLAQLKERREALRALGENISDMYGGNNTGFQYDLLGED